MGKHGKKNQHHRIQRNASYYLHQQQQDSYDDDINVVPPPQQQQQLHVSDDDDVNDDENPYSSSSSSQDFPSKFSLYQQSVQSPKGDISYLLKFFLTYVGGRVPLHLQEDFCGTALLSTEWVRSDSRRSAVGLDLDLEALNWCLENNVNKVGTDLSSRIVLFHGNVLQPSDARLVKYEAQNPLAGLSLEGKDVGSEVVEVDSCVQGSSDSISIVKSIEDSSLPARDVVCAFNYSCCCLHTRPELVLYFKHALSALSTKGGIFVMDLYGGTSSECELRMQRRFPNFTYTWEQAGFDIVQRKTRISLHYTLLKQQKKLRHAFSYSWRLWSLPEIRDCLEEAGFQSVHFWIRQMPDSESIKSMEGFGDGRDVKYEEVTSFQQQDSWNAYIVGVA